MERLASSLAAATLAAGLLLLTATCQCEYQRHRPVPDVVRPDSAGTEIVETSRPVCTPSSAAAPCPG